jgi:hypothetical protein
MNDFQALLEDLIGYWEADKQIEGKHRRAL